jgi:hypothetical protein
MEPYPFTSDPRPPIEFVLAVLAFAGVVALAIAAWRKWMVR